MIGTPETSEKELRNGLSKWLDLTERKPDSSLSLAFSTESSGEDTMAIQDATNLSKDKAVLMTSTTVDSMPVVSANAVNNGIPKYYNANLAKFALMCYNAVDGTRDIRSASALPRFLFY